MGKGPKLRLIWTALTTKESTCSEVAAISVEIQNSQGLARRLGNSFGALQPKLSGVLRKNRDKPEAMVGSKSRNWRW
jgi:hypothetical protein